MARSGNDVELLIRARDEASATLDSIVESTRDFVNQNQRADRAAKETDSTLGQLRGEYLKLEKTLAGLKEAGSLANQFAKAAESSARAKAQFQEATAEVQRLTSAQRETAVELDRSRAAYDEGRAAVARYQDELKALRATQKQLEGAAGQLSNLEQQRQKLAQLGQERAELNEQLRRGFARRQQLEQQIQSLSAAEGENAGQVRKLTAEYNRVDQQISKGLRSAGRIKKQFLSLQQATGETAGKLREYGFALADVQADERKRQASLLRVNREIEENGDALERAKAQTQAANAEVRESAKAYDQQARAVERARRAAQQAQATQQARAQRANEAATAARKAGVDTDRLSESQERVQREYQQTAQQAERAKKEVNDYAGAVGRAARDTSRAARETALWEDNSRRSMSLIQRFRGELLALGAAWFGLYGAIQQTQDAFRSFFEEEAAQARLRAVFGDDIERINEELEFVGRTADRLGQDLNVLERQYSKFLVVSNQTGQSIDVTRTIFEATAEAATVMRLSTDETAGALRAFEQILSKGKVQAEELRNQLGDRFPGAVQIMAKALGIGTQELDKMLEQGQLTSDVLLEFGLQLKKEFGGTALQKATQTFRAELNRLTTEYTRLQRVFGREAAEQLTGPVRELTRLLGTGEAQEAVTKLAQAMGAAARGALALLDYVDEIVLLLKTFAAFKITQVLYGMAAGMAAFARSTRGASKSVRGLNKAFLLFFLAVQGYNFAKYLFDEFKEIQKFAAALIAVFKKAGAAVLAAWEIIGVRLSEILENPLTAARRALRDFYRDLEDLARLLPGVGDELASMYEQLARAVGPSEEDTRRVDKKVEAIRARLKKRLAEIDEEAIGVFVEIDREFSTRGGNEGEDTSDADAQKRAARLARVQALAAQRERDRINQEAAAARKDLAEDVAERLKRIDRQIAEAEADTLQERLALIRSEYSELLKDLQTLGDTAGVKTVERLIELRQKAETQDFNRERAQKAEERLNQTIAYRQTLIDNVNTRRENGIITATEAKTRLAEIDDRLLGTIREQAREAQKFAAAMGDEKMVANIENLILGLEKTEDQLISAQQINERLAGGFTDTLEAFSNGLGRAVFQTRSLGGAFRSAADAFRSFAADFLRQIARMIAQQAILEALQNSGYGGTVAAAINHSGGVVGASAPTRTVSPLWFANARRYHDGGLPGLKADEVPTILQRGERVLSRDENRDYERGRGAPGQQQSGTNLKIVNAIDSGSVVSEGMNTTAGQKAIVNFIRANKSTVKRVLS